MPAVAISSRAHGAETGPARAAPGLGVRERVEHEGARTVSESRADQDVGARFLQVLGEIDPQVVLGRRQSETAVDGHPLAARIPVVARIGPGLPASTNASTWSPLELTGMHPADPGAVLRLTERDLIALNSANECARRASTPPAVNVRCRGSVPVKLLPATPRSVTVAAGLSRTTLRRSPSKRR